jgi:hypothetical protein
MGRGRALGLGRLLALLAAGFVGYLFGDWHAVMMRATELSASQNIALRFPEPKADFAVADAAADVSTGTAANTLVSGEPRLALLSPDSMVSTQQTAHAQMPARVQLASAEDVTPLPPIAETATARSVTPVIVRPKAETPKADTKPAAAVPPKADPNKVDAKSAAAAPDARHASRQGFVLNDAQIASIKTRLHLSPGQEQMWPAVEAALRNIAYAKARDGRRHSGATSADVASLDPDSAEVQGLKSAAFPLIMSFSDDQRNEVRGLAHVMGLDKLASEL